MSPEGARGPSALVFDIQRFSVHDGPGIRTTVFFKGCPLRCRWCQNPESLRPHPEIAFYGSRCRRAGACVEACPKGAIRVDGDRFLRGRCDACGLCVPACPFNAWQVVGRLVPVDRLAEEATRDRPFFEASGGGVTLSGGEPTHQMEAMGALARLCRERGVPVGLQTCGAFRWEAFEPHRSLFDFIHYDLKALDPELHRRLTGADNRAILDNARRLVQARAPVLFRMPVVPGLNDTEGNLGKTAVFLREMGVRALHLLRYHRMGESKLEPLGFPLPPLDLANGGTAAACVERAAERLRAEGLEVRS